MNSVKIGEGCKKTRETQINFGALSAGVTKDMLKMTLKEIAINLGKQMKITNGSIDFISIEFGYHKQ